MQTLSLADARAQLSRLVDSAVTTHERFTVTRNGARAAVLLAAEDFDAMLETLDLLGSAEEMAALREGLDDLEAGRTTGAEELRRTMIERGRLRE